MAEIPRPNVDLEIDTPTAAVSLPPPATQAPAAQSQALADQAQIPADQALEAPNYDVDQAEKSVQAYKQIANLHEINLHYPIHKLALEEWQRTEEFLSNSVSRKQGRCAELANQIYNIVGFFAVFQGAVLIAVSQLTQTANTELPLCGKIWSPIVLSLFSTIVTIVGILLKFRSLQSLELTIHTERQALIEVAKRALHLRREGPQKFKFHLDTNNSIFASKAKSSLKKYLFLVIVVVVIFTCICILSYFVILCDTGVVRK